jgi:hypothetical protein
MPSITFRAGREIPDDLTLVAIHLSPVKTLKPITAEPPAPAAARA